MDNCLQRISVQRRQIAPLGNVDSRQQPVDRLLWSGYRKIAAKEQLVEHTPLGGQAEGVILRPRSIELSRDVRIDVRVFANDGNGVRLPWMADVRHHNAQVRE